MTKFAIALIPLAGLYTSMALAPSMAAEFEERKLTKGEKEVQEATEVLEKIMSDPDTRIPADLLAQSEGIAIIPGVVQAGFFLGGRRGSGIIMLRYPDGTWSNPAFVKLTGGSLGLQFGAKSSDIVMVFPSRRTVNEVLNSSYDIGGSVTGVAGPVGGTAVDPTEQYSRNQIYTYSRSNGLFGGVSLDGSKLGLIRKTNRKFYGRRVSARKIFRDPAIEAPVIVDSLREILSESEQGIYNRY